MSEDGFEDEAALEEHLEAVKPEPVDEEELDALVEPTHEMRTAKDDEQASMDDAGRGTAGDVDATESASDGLDVLAEPVTELRTVQDQEAGDEAGDGDE